MSPLRLFGPPNVQTLEAKRDVPGLIKALRYEKDVSIRTRAAIALGQIGDSRAVGPLIMMLHSEYYADRNAAADALVKFGSSAEMITLLPAVLTGTSAFAREMAAHILTEIGAVQPLVKALTVEESRWIAADALAKLGPAAVEPLAAALYDSETGPDAVGVLERIGDARAVEALAKALELSHSLVVRRATAKALGVIGGPSVVGPLVAALEDADDGTRLAALQALEAMRSDHLAAASDMAVKPLTALLEHDGSDIRWHALKVVTKIGGPDVVELLAAVLDNPASKVRLPAAEALAGMGEARAIGALVESTSNGLLAAKAIGLLQQLLERAAASAATEDLRAIADLHNVQMITTASGSCGNYPSYQEEAVDCSRLKQLARQELIRRGLEA